MNANELMINDWVRINATRTGEWAYFQVGGYDPNKKSIFIKMKDTEWAYGMCPKMFYPIPLTAEMLKRNGMNITPYGAYFPGDTEHKCELSQYSDGSIYWTINTNEYYILPLNHVHELQHALRLCGLNELADNWRI